MLILGIVLLVVAVLVAIAVIVTGSSRVQLDLDVFMVSTNATAVFLAGAAVLLLVVLSLWMISSGLQRNKRKRSEMKTLRNRADENEHAAAEERARREEAEHTGRSRDDGSDPYDDRSGNEPPSYPPPPRL